MIYLVMFILSILSTLFFQLMIKPKQDGKLKKETGGKQSAWKSDQIDTDEFPIIPGLRSITRNRRSMNDR